MISWQNFYDFLRILVAFWRNFMIYEQKFMGFDGILRYSMEIHDILAKFYDNIIQMEFQKPMEFGHQNTCFL